MSNLSTITTTTGTEFLLESSTTIDYLQLVSLRDSVRFWIQRILVPLVAMTGLFGNLMTVMVMCQQQMRSTSTHIYLATLALFDAAYLIFNFLLSIQHYPLVSDRLLSLPSSVPQEEFNDNILKVAYWFSYPALIFCCDLASNTSIWLTVLFTIERYIAIRFPLKMRILCTRSRALKMIIIIGFLCSLVTLPTYFEYKIYLSFNSETEQNRIEIGKSSLGRDSTYQIIYFWFCALTFTLIPLSLLTVVNGFLIWSVKKQSRKRSQWIRHMTIYNSLMTTSSGQIASTTTSIRHLDHYSLVKSSPSKKQNRKIQPSNRKLYPTQQLLELTLKFNRHRKLKHQDSHITRLLIAVVIFFIICQLPSALVWIYQVCHPPSTSSEISDQHQLLVQIMGNIANLLMAINAAGNFILYCLLSRRYRQTLSDLVINSWPFKMCTTTTTTKSI